MGISNFVFLGIFIVFIGVFIWNLKKIISNIKLGREIDRSDNKPLRLKNMIRVALGQSKMTRRPIAGVLHIIVYLGFLIINIEVIEIVVDGIFGTHRFLATIIPTSLYNFLIASLIFLIRRNVLRIKRFWSKEMTSWPRTDANLILIFEILLMGAFLTMNATDALLVSAGADHYSTTFSNPISQFLHPLFSGMEQSSLIFLERCFWWFHIIGILGFMNYIQMRTHFPFLLKEHLLHKLLEQKMQLI